MKYIFCFLAFLCQGCLYGQFTKPKTVGDSLYGITVQPIENAAYTSFKLTDKPGKLYILDFFATWCGACIAALPKLDSLQNQFRDSLSILVISYESPDIIKRFLKTNLRVKNIRLPFLTGDTFLHQTFPHYLKPHEVWIKNGRVIAITEAASINSANLKAAFSTSGIHLPIKRDILGFNPALSLRSQLKTSDSILFLRQNLLTHQVDGLETRRGMQLTAGKKRIYFLNWGLLSLFQHAWKFQANRVLLEVKDSGRYLDRTSDPQEWNKNNLFCYEGIFPAACPDSLILEDLKTTLQSASPLMGSWQKRVLPCYELVTGSSRPEISRFAHPVFKPDGQSGNLLLQGYTLPALTTLFNDAAKPSPGKPIIINKTGIDYPVDLVIPARALTDPDLLQQSLIKYHLKLIPTIRPLSVFVLTENPSYNNH